MRTLQLLLFFCSTFSGFLGAQPGCTDPLATNFNPNATANDGSCMYAPTNYSPTLRTELSTALNESSGLVMAAGALWTQLDGGNTAEIFKIDTSSNSILQTVTIGGATNVDWEDIAFDGTNFYIGDFGNNSNGNRTDLKIYKFPLAAIPSGVNVTVPADQVELIQFSYADQTDFNPTGSNNTRFDCEAMIYYQDSLHLFTKDWINKTTTHYTLPATAGTYAAMNRQTFDVQGLVTAADISSDSVLLLLGYDLAQGQAFFWMVWNYPGTAYFEGNKRRIDLGSVFSTGQVEGICFRNATYGYISNEKFSVFVPARLTGFQIAPWLQGAGVPVFQTNLKPIPCKVRPNPVRVGQNYALPVLPSDPDLRVEIWNAQAQQIWQGDSVDPLPQSLAAGMYLLNVLDDKGQSVCRNKIMVY